ncbi:MAG: NAD(P)H-hydrate dehydratase [Hormoscilla sp. GUM202]|nr:NAD(P)H-hydrate dehydratase [Hormoscilla sp. GUM202]
MKDRAEQIQQIAVTAAQMREIEERIFAAGMPVAALMEKVAGLLARRIESLYPEPQRVGVLVGPGHNGGDALVVARELHFHSYDVTIYKPLSKLKQLTSQHAEYAACLGIPFHEEIAPLQDCHLLIDGLFGFGLERTISEGLAEAVNELNSWSKPVLSIDIPAGIHTDTGAVLGTAVRATRTFCLGLWKLAFLQDQALEYIGKAELIDFDIPWADIEPVINQTSRIYRITAVTAIAHLPIPRPRVTHKYKEGHLLSICGSRKYAGAGILTGLGAQASGVGMLSIAVPESLKQLLVAQLPSALIIGCPETKTGAIAQLPVELSSYSAIACGPGLTTEAVEVVEKVLESDRLLVLDADGLNILASLGPIARLSQRQVPTVLTPHTIEFKRLFPEAPDPTQDRIKAVQNVSGLGGAVVLLKGALTAIVNHYGSVWIIPESTPALARGGSGDVLTGLLGGLLAQAPGRETPIEGVVVTAAWCHAQAGMLAASERTELGVDALTLTQYLMAAVGNAIVDYSADKSIYC